MLLLKNGLTAVFRDGFSGVLIDRPCWVHAINLSYSGGGSKKLIIKDGLVSDAPILFKFYNAYGYGKLHSFKYPVFFKHGMYIDADNQITIGHVYYEYAEDFSTLPLLLFNAACSQVDIILKDIDEWFTRYRSLLPKTQVKRTRIDRFYKLLKGWFTK